MYSLKMYNLYLFFKKMYNLNCLIVIISNYTRAYAPGCTLVKNNRQI